MVSSDGYVHKRIEYIMVSFIVTFMTQEVPLYKLSFSLFKCKLCLMKDL